MNWAVKYRPSEYEQLALSPHIRKIFDEVIKTKHMGDFLFYSPMVGCGKTTLAKLLPEILDLEPLFINASKDGNMDTIRNKIDKFIEYGSMGYEGKLIILDEAEKLTQQAQGSLRGILEEERYQNLNFIFTTNDKSKIIDSISNSRLLPLDFSLPIFSKNDKDFVESVFKPIVIYLESILKNNNIEYDIKDVMTIVKEEYPGIRRMVVKMEFSIFNNKLELSNNRNTLNEEDCINIIKNKDKKEIYLLSQKLNDCNFLIDYINTKLLDLFKLDDISKVIELINIYQTNNSNGLMFPKINSLNLFYKLSELDFI